MALVNSGDERYREKQSFKSNTSKNLIDGAANRDESFQVPLSSIFGAYTLESLDSRPDAGDRIQ